MPFPAICLLGFMSEDEARNYLRNACVLDDDSDEALKAEWEAAKQKLTGGPTNPGNPDIRDLDDEATKHVEALRSGPWKQVIDANPTWDFKLVEIAPLLAFQFSILTDRSTNHCDPLGDDPSMAQLLELCLPSTPSNPSAHVSRGPQSVMIQSRDLNLRVTGAGLINNMMGMNFAFALPFVHVVRFNGRCYLLNGYHRSYGAGCAGTSHVPCIFTEAATPEEAGIRPDGTTFSQAVMESDSPPTLHHFTSGQTQAVQLKPLNRVLHVSWSEYLVPDEEF